MTMFLRVYSTVKKAAKGHKSDEATTQLYADRADSALEISVVPLVTSAKVDKFLCRVEDSPFYIYKVNCTCDPNKRAITVNICLKLDN